MTIATNTFLTYSAKGIREDLSNQIYNISPETTPFMNNIGRGTASNTLFQWQTDTLADNTTANAQLQGDDISTYDAVTPTVQLTNYTQISRKTVVISGTVEAVSKAGRKSELAYNLAKRAAELKRDMETIMLANQAATAGDSTTAQKTGSLLAFIKTNTDKGTDGADPVYTTLPNDDRSDGVTRAFTETILKSVLQKVWEQGGDPSIVMVGAKNKQVVSGFNGIATRYRDVPAGKQAQIIGAADVYVGDFGQVNIVPNRFQRDRDAFVLSPDYAGVHFLRPFQQVELATTGDAEKRLLLAEYGLAIYNEKAHGLAADLST
ncbi:MAG: DUF5309 domain-containing protein [Ilumatobacteraceae bacterium]